MAKRYAEIDDKVRRFIAAQKLFFVGTAAAEGHVNVSPKGMDSLRVLAPKRVVWLNVTGSGNETAAHLLETPRITLMFCAFEGEAMILRVYGKAIAYHAHDPQWQDLISLFPQFPGARQIIDVEVDLVQTSCGTAVPFFAYQGEREQLNEWAAKKGADGIRQYWQDRNQVSLDGKPTGILQSS